MPLLFAYGINRFSHDVAHILLANDTESHAFRSNYRSGHYNVVGTSSYQWTSPYQMVVPSHASTEE